MANNNLRKATKVAEFLPYAPMPTSENEIAKIVPIRPDANPDQPALGTSDNLDDPVAKELRSMYQDINATIEETKSRLLDTFQQEMQKTLEQAISKASEKDISPANGSNPSTPNTAASGLKLVQNEPSSDLARTSDEGAKMHNNDAAEHAQNPSKEPEQEAVQPKTATNGSVRLSVNSYGQMRQALQFIECLYQKPQLHLVRLEGNYKDKLDIWIELREPIYVKEYLSGIKDVARVLDIDSLEGDKSEQAFEVQLNLVS